MLCVFSDTQLYSFFSFKRMIFQHILGMTTYLSCHLSKEEKIEVDKEKPIFNVLLV